jgi:hypothetical protein
MSILYYYFNYIYDNNLQQLSFLYVILTVFLYIIIYCYRNRIDITELTEEKIKEAKNSLISLYNNKKLMFFVIFFSGILMFFKTVVLSFGLICLVLLMSNQMRILTSNNIGIWLLISSIPVFVLYIKTLVDNLIQNVKRGDIKNDNGNS